MSHFHLSVVVLAGALATTADPYQHVLDIWRDQLGITGIQATVILPDGREVTRTSGNAHAGAEVRPDTVFEIGSVTKSFTAALALRLVEQGVLSLDDTVGSDLPEDAVDPAITLRQLLNHTSGLHNVSMHPGYLPAQLSDPAKHWTPADNLAFLQAPYFEPGVGWRYSNTNYIVAGMMLEAATGDTVGMLFHRKLFEPANLRHTIFGAEHALPDERAHAFIDIQGDDSPEDITAVMPATAFLTSAWTAGAVLSTSGELARWMRALHTGALLSDSTYSEMTTFVERPDGMRYGLGVLRMERDGQVWLGHKGNSAGFSGAAWHLPDSDISIAVLSNAHLIDVQPVTAALVSVAMGATPELPQPAAASQQPDTDRMRATELAAVAGARLADGEPAHAIDVLERALELDPGNADLHAALADACVKAISPRNPVKAFRLGRRAQAEYHAALELAPGHVPARLGLLRYYLGAPAIIGGSTDKALEQAGILERFDERAGWRAYRMIYTHIGDDARAAEYAARLEDGD